MVLNEDFHFSTNLQKEDNLIIKDKMPGPKVSFVIIIKLL